MSINPKVNEQLKGVSDLEVKRLIISTYRYNSISGKSLSDAVRYEKATGDKIGKNFDIQNGDFLEPQAVSVFCQLFPVFDKECLAYLNQLPADERTVREVFSRFAIYLAENIANIGVEDKEAVFEVIELILNHGQSSLKNIIGNYFLEDFQNIYGNLGNHPDEFYSILKPETKVWWNEINRFWKDLERYYEKSN